MKVSLLWLKEFVDFDLSPEGTASLLRGLGFELASLERFGGPVKNVVTARVESAEKHPNADRLSLCRVFDGKDRWEVVCGAPNVAPGQAVALARVGAELPGGLKIEKAVIRGRESSGMICSAKELGLGQDHSGILVLPEGTPPGEDAARALQLGDAVLDLEVTPNRPDALSHWGVAREIAAALNKKLRLPDLKIPKSKPLSNLVKIEETRLCSRYIGRVIEGVRVGPAPLWMKLRLERCGIRAINNVVDVTNYVLLELGHPLHAFDLDRLEGNRVVVRRAKPGESLACLDEVTRNLPDNSLVIADAAKPAAVAGVMGGEPSGVREGTVRLLLESAHFDAPAIRRTRKALNLSTESSYRFERGADWDMTEQASRRAARLLLSLTGGKLTGEQDARARKPATAAVKARPARINALLGLSLPAAKMKSALERLGFRCRTAGASLAVVPPMHRHDVREEADVAEEIGRLTGYDAVPPKTRVSSVPAEAPSRERGLAGSGRDALFGLGFFEARTYGLVSRRDGEKLPGALESPVELDNPISLQGEFLAPTLLVNLLQSLQRNRRHGNQDARLFEIARVFSLADGVPKEHSALAWAAYGNARPDHWQDKPRPLNVWDAKAWVEALLREWRVSGVSVEGGGAPAFCHPGESLSLSAGGRRLGFAGLIHPRQAEAHDLPSETLLAELDLSAMASLAAEDPRFRGLPKHPAVYRDFSLAFPETVSWADVARRLARVPWVEETRPFDVFKDPSLPAGHRSLAFRVTFRHPERTLTDQEVGKTQEDILKDLQALGAVARGPTSTKAE